MTANLAHLRRLRDQAESLADRLHDHACAGLPPRDEWERRWWVYWLAERRRQRRAAALRRALLAGPVGVR